MTHTPEAMRKLVKYMEHANIDIEVAERDLELPQEARAYDLELQGLVKCQGCWCWERPESLLRGLCQDCQEDHPRHRPQRRLREG